jgi:hypothetical protein
MIGKATLITAGFCVALIPLACSAGGSVDMKPGEWSITMKTNMEGMPFAMPPVTMKQCLSEKDLVPQTSGAQQQGQAQNCEILDQKIEGNTVSWSVSCTDNQGGTTKGKGSVTYSGTSFSGSTEMSVTSEGQTMKMNVDMSGKWLGPCKQ